MDLATRIDIPGSWFGATEAGALNAGEKRSKYVAVAVEFNAKHVFEQAGGRRAAKVGEAIRFVCPEDA